MLNDLNFDLQSPSLVAIVGHNGVGKTTFLKALTSQAPFEGLFCFNETTFSTSRTISPNQYAYLEQKNEISFEISVLETVVMGCYGKKKFLERYAQEDYNQALEMLDLVGLTGFEHRSITELSGGESRLVFLAQMLMQNAELLLLDEPTNALDIRNKTKVMNVLKELPSKGKTVLFTTHDLDYLAGITGFIINFSETTPILEPITLENIYKHKAMLMK